MGRVIVKKVRLTEEEAAELSLLSRETNRSESEILRTAIARERRLNARRKHVAALAEMSTIGADIAYRWEGRE